MQILREQTRLILASFIVGAIVGGSIFGLFVEPVKNGDYAVRAGGYTFINPLLSCNLSENKEFKEYGPANDKLTDFIDSSILKGDAQKISVYFRGLNSGHWAGVNENEEYAPASLLKVPILIAYLKLSETQPGLLNSSVVYESSVDENMLEEIKPTKAIQNGGTYSIAELLKYMIVYSDNNATKFLQDHLDQNALIDVYSDLGISEPKSLTDETVSAKNYSYMFRLLYNGTYLNKSISEYALKLLSAGNFKDGLRAGVPIQTIVSQKFGERTVKEKNISTGAERTLYKELHDCGVIYYPKNPYLLCVMTKGDDYKKLKTIISSLSSIVYKEISIGTLKL